MGKIKYSSFINEINGEVVHGSGLIHRRKHYRDSGIAGAKEIYRREPRDYKSCPMTPAENACTERFRLADQRMREILSNRDSEEFHYWHERFQKQLKKPDQDSPLDQLGYHKTYKRLDAYIRTKLMKTMN